MHVVFTPNAGDIYDVVRAEEAPLYDYTTTRNYNIIVTVLSSKTLLGFA